MRNTCLGCGGTSSSSYLCGRCAVRGATFDGVTWSYEYGGAVADAISAFKFRQAIEHARGLTADCVLPVGSWDYLIPVPLHWTRLRSRGFNQSALLARCISKRHGIAVAYQLLHRTRNTCPQRNLPESSRRSNIKRAFTASCPEAIIGRNILLVDDVMTTGTTLLECSKVLRAHGARRVGAWTVARRT
mgnify:CR=1 FL=1